MIAVFDTETTGRPVYPKRRSDPLDHLDPRQPRIVQLAVALFEGEEMHMQASVIVRPEGFKIPEEVTRECHGISDEFALAHGIDIKAALGLFVQIVRSADTFLGFNIAFDMMMVRRELALINRPDPFEGKDTLCAMLGSKDILKLPNQHGYSDYKFPKLQEAYAHFYGKPFEDAHDAFADLKATMAVHLAIERHFQSLPVNPAATAA